MSTPNSSEIRTDEYDHYNEDIEKYVRSSNSGKQRTKREASDHTNHNDPCGHSRKILTKLINTEHNKRDKK